MRCAHGPADPIVQGGAPQIQRTEAGKIRKRLLQGLRAVQGSAGEHQLRRVSRKFPAPQLHGPGKIHRREILLQSLQLLHAGKGSLQMHAPGQGQIGQALLQVGS